MILANPATTYSKPLRRDQGLFASIDLGTQANLLLIARIKRGVVMPEQQVILSTGTGRALRATTEGAWSSGRISDALVQRMRQVVTDFKAEIRRREATLVAVGATSAYRQSSNGREVLMRLSEVLHFPCRLLTGEEEAEFSRAGVANLYPDPKLTVFDLGGGSTEMSWVGGSKSVALGALTMAIPLEENAERAMTMVLTAYREALNQPNAAGSLSPWPVLVGGSALALAHLECGMRAYDPESVEGCRLTLAGLQHWVRVLRSMSLSERELLPGIEPGRGALLLAGAVLIQALAETSKCQGFILSSRGLRFGLLLDGARRMGA